MNFGGGLQAMMANRGMAQGSPPQMQPQGGLSGDKGAARQMPNMPQAGQGFPQPQDQAGRAALMQAMIARSRAGYGG